ncbi:hypothetical protein H9P43_004836 [Blastocladiella emersonii ATCC 22665]|nr:hypothetical protein H9P43_004836 [Blastocladiella emersonii ATCC 22665]
MPVPTTTGNSTNAGSATTHLKTSTVQLAGGSTAKAGGGDDGSSWELTDSSGTGTGTGGRTMSTAPTMSASLGNLDTASVALSVPPEPAAAGELKGLPVALWRDRIFRRYFDVANDRSERSALVKAAKASRGMFAAAAGALYASLPFASLSYNATKKVFTDAILKSDRPDRIAKGRHYGSMLRVLDLSRTAQEFADKKLTDANIHRVLTLAANLEEVSLPFSRRPLEVAQMRKDRGEAPITPPVARRASVISGTGGDPNKSPPAEDLVSLDAAIKGATENVLPDANKPGLTDRIIRSLSRIAVTGHLRSITLGNIHDFSADAPEHLFGQAPGLRVLKLQARFTPPAGAATGTTIAEALVRTGAVFRLRELHLTEVPIDGPAWSALMHALGSVNQLRVLALSGIQLSDAAVRVIGGAQGGPGPALRELNVSVENVIDTSALAGDAAWTAVLAGCPQLRVLGLSHMPVTDAAVRALTANAPRHLKSLSVVEGDLADPMTLAALVAECPKLAWVDISGCARLRHNSTWAAVFNLPESANETNEDGEEPWWMADGDDLTMGARRLQEVRECAAKHRAA